MSSTSMFTPDNNDDQLAVMLPLPFAALMELLEFSRLRLDGGTAAKRATRGRAVVGSQDWICAPDIDHGSAEVYVCSTVASLQDATLPPEDTQLRVEVTSRKCVRLQALQRRHADGIKQLSCLRVDLQALIHRVIVPAKMPSHLYELIKHVVLARVWVDVVRA